MAYCLPAHIRILTGLSTTDITDNELDEIIKFAAMELNQEINSKIYLEIVSNIDNVRQNIMDGANKTFYVRKSFDWYLADLNNDGSVTIADIEVWEYKNDNTRSQMTVLSIDEVGKFILTVAPAQSSVLKVTYSYAPVSEQQPHALIKKACSELAAAYSYTKVSAESLNTISLGTLKVGTKASGFERMRSQYERTLVQLKTRISRRTDAPEYYKSLDIEGDV
jgi:hypothetical protein